MLDPPSIVRPTKKTVRIYGWSRYLLFLVPIIFILSGTQSTEPTPHRTLPLSVEYSGCTTVFAGPVCVLKKTRILSVWVQTESDAELIFKGRYRILQEPVLVAGGKRFEIEVENGSNSLELNVKKDSAENRWTLDFSWQGLPAWFSQADKLRAKGKLEEARTILEKERSNDKHHIGLLHTALARLLYFEGKISQAESRYRKAIEHYTESKYLSHRCRDASALAYLYVLQGRRFDMASKLLESALPPKGFADSIINFTSVKAYVAAEMGDYRQTVRQYSRALLSANRLRPDLKSRIEEDLAMYMLVIGRRKEAMQSLDNILRQSDHSAEGELRHCQRASLLTRIVYSKTLSYEAREDVSEPPFAQIKEGLRLLDQHRCPDAHRFRFQLLHSKILTLLHYGQVQQAELGLTSLRKISQNRIENKLLIHEIEARVAHAKQDAISANHLFRKLLEFSVSADDPIMEWKATIGVAQSLALMKKYDAALATYKRAHQLSRESVLKIALGDGRASFMAQRTGAFQQHIELLVKLKRNVQALAVARGYLIQELRSLQRSSRLATLPPSQKAQWNKLMSRYQVERDKLSAEGKEEWELSEGQLLQARQGRKQDRLKLKQILDEAYSIIADDDSLDLLTQPGKDELFLLYYPSPTKWIGFASDQQSVEVKEIVPIRLHSDSRPTKSQIAEQLLNPFSEKINRNKKITILSTSKLQSIDFHGLPWSGDVLVAKKQVRYSLDLARKRSRVTIRKNKRKALLVIDPESNLPKARQEVTVIENALKESGDWEVKTLVGDNALRSVVWQELQNANWFHFSGHADYGSQRGWNSALRLAKGTSLKITDLLSIEHAPDTVVLLGCETGLSHAESGSNIGLAQAFLAAGSQTVIASTRPLSDAASKRFSSLFYGQVATKSDDVAGEFQKAHVAQREQSRTDDWSSLRLYIP